MTKDICPLSEYEKQLTERLRTEAEDVKQCFTNFSFKALAFTAAILGVIVHYQKDNPYVALTTIPVAFLLVAVSRIGTHKFATANRNFGYELHLFRTRHISDSSSNGWQAFMREIGWEEAMRAWRIVHATIFCHTYVFNFFLPNILRKEHWGVKERWFEPPSLREQGSYYWAGSYLRIMLGLLHTLAVISIIPMYVASHQFRMEGEADLERLFAFLSLCLLLFVVSRVTKDIVRRRILESGMLSIHSCAISWQAVVVAHYRALQRIVDDKQRGFHNYTKYLSLEAIDLSKHVLSIPGRIM